MSKSIGESLERVRSVYLAASVPTSAISSSNVTISPARLLILMGRPPRLKDTNW